jgi:hypothetical protein
LRQTAQDCAGILRDTSQLCPGSFYNTYSGAIACADGLGYKINAILGTDGGWSGTNAGMGSGQTFLFRNTEINQLTRFPSHNYVEQNPHHAQAGLIDKRPLGAADSHG